MAGFRFLFTCALMLLAADNVAAQTNRARRKSESATAPNEKNRILRVYSLAGMSDDAKFGQWIADTIPQMIQPGSWATPVHSQVMGTAHSSFYQPPSAPSAEPTKGTLSYYSQGRTLVVHHTAAVHAQVESLLKEVNAALPAARAGEPAPIAQAQYSAPARMPESVAYNKSTAYPVPAPLAQPKHLFHLVIRYEGGGVIDANMADVVKAFYGDVPAKDDKSVKPTSASTKSPDLSQLFNFIIRYEGEGIVDSNVVSMVKALTNQKDSCAAPVLPSGTYLQRSPYEPVVPASGSPLSPKAMPPADAPMRQPAPASSFPIAPPTTSYSSPIIAR